MSPIASWIMPKTMDERVSADWLSKDMIDDGWLKISSGGTMHLVVFR
jgi:hypothetical protein